MMKTLKKNLTERNSLNLARLKAENALMTGPAEKAGYRSKLRKPMVEIRLARDK
jgi:hypothetical protein